ncbi:MAG: hypothetical protein GXP40_03115 [Chloroflexi bacterium]|nr:hypothetical protein [Chloroflexota bacterium]
MNKGRLGCFSASAITAFALTLLVLSGVAFAGGAKMFNPGGLNAQSGEGKLGGVASHAEVGEQCSACHVAPWSADNMGDRCADCHTEINADLQNASSLHGSLMQDSPQLQCRACHPEHRGPAAALVEMDPATFPHETVGFSLEAHAQNADGTSFTCGDCHIRGIASFDPTSCADCHRQLDVAFARAHTLAYGADCLACHDGVETYGKDFDHGRADFKLSGKHTAVVCSGCHLDARSIDDLKAAPQDCVACHRKDDEHNGKFGADCAACHTPEDWEAADFDHNLSDFKLEGKHAGVDCEECHVNNVYKGTPTDCYACHQRDDEHNGEFGTDCSACHNPTDWEDAVFDHSRADFPLTGAHVNVKCEQCHVNDTFAGTPADCAACHADPDFHAGAFGADCASCHTSSGWSPAQYRASHPVVADEGGRGINHGGASCTTCHPSTVYSYTCLACHSDNQGGEGGGDD